MKTVINVVLVSLFLYCVAVGTGVVTTDLSVLKPITSGISAGYFVAGSVVVAATMGLANVKYGKY